MPPSFQLDWRLTVEDARADTLAEAVAPETDPEHATLTVEAGTLEATGHGPAGACLHTLDDLLACLTGAVEALDVDRD